MADYKDIVGTAVRNNAGNLSSDQQDQIFYDSTNLDFKYQFAATIASWRTANSLNTARSYLGGCGTQTAALAFGGEPSKNETESYNGTSFTEVNNLNNAREGSAPAGTSTSALYAGGYPTTYVESWNGSSWTEVADLNTARTYIAGAGADNTSAVVFGGYAGPPSPTTNNTEVWNGSSWTEVNNLNTARTEISGAGISTSGLAVGGTEDPPARAYTESWDGTSWTEVSDMNYARQSASGSGPGGTNTSVLAFGGTQGSNPTVTANTELWNGSSWAEQNNLSQARFALGGAGTSSTTALAMGGRTTAPAIVGIAEEWNASTPVGAWTTTTSVNTARLDAGGAGSNAEAALAFGGQVPGSPALTGATESFNGSTWTEVNDMNSPRNGLASNGTQTSALAHGQDDPGVAGTTESWNGSSWTSVASLNTGKRACGGFGADNTSALSFGGESASADNEVKTESWNGSSWTEVNDMNTGRSHLGGTGIITAGIAIGGRVTPPNALQSVVEQWNGTNWTEVGDLNTARYSGFYSQFNYADSFIGGGQVPSYVTNTEIWDGISWTETSDMNTARGAGSSAGTQTSGLASSGYSGTYQSAVEEWSGSSNTIKVLTD